MGYLEIAAAGLIWAVTGPLVRGLIKAGFTSWDVVLGRALFSITFMGFWLILRSLRRRTQSKQRSGDEPLDPSVPSLQDIPVFLALGFLAVVLSQVTYFYALSQTSVAVAVTLNYTAPFFVMLLSFLVYKEPLSRSKVGALLGAVAGVALASGFIGSDVNANTLGVLAGLLSGFAYGSQTLIYKRVGTRYGPITLNFWTMALGTLDLSVLLMIMTGKTPEVIGKIMSATPSTWLMLLLVGLGPGTTAFILFADGINKVEATRGSIVAMTEPIAACVFGYFLLGESLSLLQVIGIFMVLGSIWAVSVAGAPSRRKGQASVDRQAVPDADE